MTSREGLGGVYKRFGWGLEQENSDDNVPDSEPEKAGVDGEYVQISL